MLRLAAAIAMLPFAASRAEEPPPPTCEQAFTAYTNLTSHLLEASLHGEEAYRSLREQLDPTANAAVAACGLDNRAKRAIYDSKPQVSTYQSTRDAALRILQRTPPVPMD